MSITVISRTTVPAMTLASLRGTVPTYATRVSSGAA